MKKSFHVVVPQFAICSDLTYPQLLKSAQICCGQDESMLAITCQQDVAEICEYADWLSGKQSGFLKPEAICQECVRFVKSTLDLIPHESMALRDVLREAAVNFTELKFPQQTNRENIASFLDANPIYREIILSSIATEFKLSSDFSVFDLPDAQFHKFLKDLRAAIDCYLAFCSFFRKNDVRSVHIWNGRFLVQRAVLRAARQSGVPTFVYERGIGALPILVMNESATFQQVEFSRSVKRGLYPFNFQDSFNLRRDFLLNKALGFTLYAFTDYPDEAHIREILSRARNRRIVSLFTSSDYEFLEYQGLEWDRSGVLFRNQQEFLDWFLTVVKKYSDIFFSIRIHPNEGRRSMSKRVPVSIFAQNLMDTYKKLGADNVEVVHPDDPLSAYALLSVSSLSITYGSSVGMEASQLGIPSIVSGDAFYRKECAIFPESLEEMEDFVSGKKTLSKQKLLENSARAWVIDASMTAFAVWHNSGLRVRAYEQGITPIYDSSAIDENSLEFAPRRILQSGKFEGQELVEPRMIMPSDSRWIHPLPTSESMQAQDVQTLSDFLSSFWNCRLGFPTPRGSVQSSVWELDQGRPIAIAAPVIRKLPGFMKRKFTILWVSLWDFWLYRDSRSFIASNVRIAWRIAVARTKSKLVSLMRV